MSESAIYAPMVEALNATGLVYVWRSQSGVIRKARRAIHLAPKGTADIVGIGLRGALRGRFVSFEVKDAKGKTDKAREATQAAFRNRVNAHGGCAWLVTDVGQALDLVVRESMAA